MRLLEERSLASNNDFTAIATATELKLAVGQRGLILDEIGISKSVASGKIELSTLKHSSIQAFEIPGL